MNLQTPEKMRVVLGVIGADIHVVANRILAIALEQNGFDVFNLQTNNRPEDFVAACLETEAHAVLVSSINGEAEHWCIRFRARFQNVGYGHVLLYLGGNLVIGQRPTEKIIAHFKEQGFDQVYPGKTNLEEMFQLLKKEIYGRTA